MARVISNRREITALPASWQREIDAGSAFGLRAAKTLTVSPVARNKTGGVKTQRTRVRPVGGCRGCEQKTKPETFAAKMRRRLDSLKSAAVDFWRDGMTVATAEQQTARLAICSACPVFNGGWCDDSRGGCGCNLALKVKARSAFCPLGKWFAGSDVRRLVPARRHLNFHTYPKRGAERIWHWHIEQIRKYRHVFSGKIVIAISHGQDTASPEEVKRLFHGIPVAAWVEVPNTRELAETATIVPMLDHLQDSGPDDVVFRYHTKGVTKVPGAVEERWAELMWLANMDLRAVDQALEHHMTCGAFRSQKPLVEKKGGNFFFAGSAYWMRTKELFERDWRTTEVNRWWVEYLPAHLFTLAESACLFHDLTESSVLRRNYFDEIVEPEWKVWELSRGLK